MPGAPARCCRRGRSPPSGADFATLATIDRVAFGNHDSLIALAAAAAVTERIELLTNILVLPTRRPGPDREGGRHGRLDLAGPVHPRRRGRRPGGRFHRHRNVFAGRGKHTDRMLTTMQAAWRGEPVAGSPEPVVPTVPGGTVPLLIGGGGEAGVRRTVQYGVGWTAGGVPPDQMAPVAARVRQAWREAGRPGSRGSWRWPISRSAMTSRRRLRLPRHYYGFRARTRR